MQLDKRLDAYAELVCRYARNLVSLEHADMVNRGSDDGYLEIARWSLQFWSWVEGLLTVPVMLMSLLSVALVLSMVAESPPETVNFPGLVEFDRKSSCKPWILFGVFSVENESF